MPYSLCSSVCLSMAWYLDLLLLLRLDRSANEITLSFLPSARGLRSLSCVSPVTEHVFINCLTKACTIVHIKHPLSRTEIPRHSMPQRDGPHRPLQTSPRAGSILSSTHLAKHKVARNPLSSCQHKRSEGGRRSVLLPISVSFVLGPTC